MAGLIQVGRHYQDQATQGMQAAGKMKDARERAGEQIEQQEKMATMSAVGTGAAIGTMIAPGVGTAVGAAVGYLGSQLF